MPKTRLKIVKPGFFTGLLARLSHFTPHFRIFESKTPKVFTTTTQGLGLASGTCEA